MRKVYFLLAVSSNHCSLSLRKPWEWFLHARTNHRILAMIYPSVSSLTKALMKSLRRNANIIYKLKKWPLLKKDDLISDEMSLCVVVSVTGRMITLIMSSLVFRVAVRDSILAAWALLWPSISDSNDCSSAKEICTPRKKMWLCNITTNVHKYTCLLLWVN